MHPIYVFRIDACLLDRWYSCFLLLLTHKDPPHSFNRVSVCLKESLDNCDVGVFKAANSTLILCKTFYESVEVTI